jgi:hypothetical protein
MNVTTRLSRMYKSPGFHFYPDKWESHTRHLSDLAYRVFHEMLCWMWSQGPGHCQITTTPEVIAFLLNRSAESVKTALAEIQNPAMPLLKKFGKVYMSGGLKKEAEKQALFSQKQRDRAKCRDYKGKGVCRGNAGDMPGLAPAMPDINVHVHENEHKDLDLFEEDSQGETLTSPDAVLTFTVVGGGTWSLSQKKFDGFQKTYGERLDVMFECEKAQRWCEEAGENRKTPKGMGRFLVNWLNRATDKSPGKKNQKVDIAVPSQTKTGDYF